MDGRARKEGAGRYEGMCELREEAGGGGGRNLFLNVSRSVGCDHGGGNDYAERGERIACIQRASCRLLLQLLSKRLQLLKLVTRGLP